MYEGRGRCLIFAKDFFRAVASFRKGLRRSVSRGFSQVLMLRDYSLRQEISLKNTSK